MMRGHLPKAEILRERSLTAEHQLARARLRRRQMAERLAVAQEALATAARRELEAEQAATKAAAKLAAHDAGSAPTRRFAPPSPRRGWERRRFIAAPPSAQRDALLGIIQEMREERRREAKLDDAPRTRVHVAGDRFRAAGARQSSSLAGTSEGAAQTAILLPAVDQLAEA